MLVNLKEVLAEGRKRGVAVPSINTPNLESILAAIQEAEAQNIPLIIAHAELHESVISMDVIGPVMLLFAQRAKVPVCVHLDHGESFAACKRAIDLGFTGVMIDASTLPYEENIKVTKKVVEYAHQRGVGVEAELGCLPNRETGGETVGDPKLLYTEPHLVPDFVKRTGVDALAIAFGTAHGIYKVKPVLSIDVIRAVRQVSDIYLVMHGGSGLSPDDYRGVIAAGIDKINYYTYMAYAGYDAAKKLIEKEPTGFYHDLCTVATQAQQKRLKEMFTLFAEGRHE
ncbi:MAG: class II fructose-bisphosphate aldolase [Bacilli bacterium]|jgi:fructose-bisphosphate aldolase class II